MKNKSIVAVTAVAAVVAVVIFIKHSFIHSHAAKKAVSAARAEKSRPAAAVPAKKLFSKGMGGLTVKAHGANDKPQSLRIKVFRVDSKNMSVFVAAFNTERMQELTPGTYDLEIETTPAQIYKNVTVCEGK